MPTSTPPKVLYFHDNGGSIPVQIIIAKALHQLYKQNFPPVIAFENVYGKLPDLPERMHTTVCSSDVQEAFELLGNQGYAQTNFHLLQLLRQQELREGQLELWGVEDEKLFTHYEKIQEEYFKMIESSESIIRQSTRPNSLLRSKELMEMDCQMDELKELRQSAAAGNIKSLIGEKSITILPLVMSYSSYPGLQQKLKEQKVDVISYDIE